MDGYTPGEPIKLYSATATAEPSASHARIPVKILTESQPMVTVTFSECERLRGIEKMPLRLANTAFFEADEKYRDDYVKSGYNGAPYLKTYFQIDFIRNGSPESYTGRYDVGSGDGTLVEHIRDYAEYYRLDEGYQNYLAESGEGKQAVENARLDFISEVLVPIFDKHCELYDIEASAISELMSIYEDAGGQPSEADAPRIAYLESEVEYAWKCHKVLNDTGLDNLPQAPAPYKTNAKDAATRQTKGKPSVLDEIRESKSAPKAKAKPKQQGKKKTQPEL